MSMYESGYVSKEDFEKEVLEDTGTVLVDFYATWCNPCKQLSKILDIVVAERDDVKVLKVNIDASSAVALSYRVRSVPTLLLFKDGDLKSTKIGGLRKSEVEAFID